MTDLATFAEGLGEAASATDAQVAAVLALLSDFPDSGKPQDREATMNAHLLGFIEYREIQKACPTCGKPRLDYTYYRVTPSGKLFLAASLRAHAAILARGEA